MKLRYFIYTGRGSVAAITFSAIISPLAHISFIRNYIRDTELPALFQIEQSFFQSPSRSARRRQQVEVALIHVGCENLTVVADAERGLERDARAAQ